MVYHAYDIYGSWIALQGPSAITLIMMTDRATFTGPITGSSARLEPCAGGSIGNLDVTLDQILRLSARK